MKSLTLLALVLGMAGLAQAHGSALGMPEVGNLTSSAILGWYAWHTASKTIPSLVHHFREELTACRAHAQRQHELLCQELAAERHRRHADQAAIVQALTQIRDELAAAAGPHGVAAENEPV